MRRDLLLLALGVLCAGFVTAQDESTPRRSFSSPTAGRARARAALGNIPLSFVENRGVYPDAVRYFVKRADRTLFFTDGGVTFALRGEPRGWTVKLDFVRANPKVRPEGRDQRPAVFSYFRGREEDWRVGLATFATIVYRDLWPGIDLVYEGTLNKLKYAFRVAPGADPKKIRLRYRGPTSVAVTEGGALEVETPAGGFEDAAPVAWQPTDGKRNEVVVAYRLDPEPGAEFGFHVGSFDRTEPLVIDPAVLVYCGYIGGSSDDLAQGIAVDGAGCAYVTGETSSDENTFPVSVGPDMTYNGNGDVFVAKVNASGTGLTYCGYIGGGGGEWGTGIAVDGAGNAYATGATSSDEKTFPVAGGPDLSYNGGLNDVFVAKVNAHGTGLIYCGYIGGAGGANQEYSQGIAVDATGAAYVAGWTHSDERTFPVTVGPDLSHNGTEDVFVAKVNANGSSLDYCGYIGGAGREGSGGIAVDRSGCAYVTGSTDSDERTFPVRVGPDLTHNGGLPRKPSDAFVAKVDARGAALAYCGYIGGASFEWGCSIAVDAAGNAYVAGLTASDERTFPAAVGPDLTHNGLEDAFVAKVNSRGTALAYCGYLGGAAFDTGGGVAVDAAGTAYVAGYTRSGDQTFPVTVGPDLTHNGSWDGFVAKVALTLLQGSGTPRPGGSVSLALTASDDAGLSYQVGGSFGTGPIPIGTRQLGLSPDGLLVVTALDYWPSVFAGFRGVIGGNGQGQSRIHIPSIPQLIGVRLNSAFVTFSPTAPFGIKSISNTFSFSITK